MLDVRECPKPPQPGTDIRELLLTSGIPFGSRDIADYEVAKKLLWQLCLPPKDYEMAIQVIVDYVGV